jgi:hypothetical protein
MASRLGSAAVAKIVDRMNGRAGVNANLGALAAADFIAPAVLDAAQIRTGNVAAETAERSSLLKYPAMNVYCEKLVNSLDEKFRSFSGKAQMCVELRHSQDRIEGLQDALETYADAARQVLEGSRGDWGDGMFYAGGYEVTFGAVKHGGRNFVQAAKITFELGVSR